LPIQVECFAFRCELIEHRAVSWTVAFWRAHTLCQPKHGKFNMKTLNLIKSCLFTGLFLAGLASCSKPAAEKATVEGRWSGFEAGNTERITVAFSSNQFTYWDAKTNEIGSGTFVINDTVQPRQMDLTFERIIAPEYVGKVGLAIFELQGDELTFAGAEPGSTLRPTNIAGGQGVRVFSFKRE
jgi:uncharacterized protein (TIGR03067 family)